MNAFSAPSKSSYFIRGPRLCLSGCTAGICRAGQSFLVICNRAQLYCPPSWTFVCSRIGWVDIFHISWSKSGTFCHAGSVALWMEILSLRSVHHFVSDWNISTTLGWIAMKCGTDVYDPRRIYPKDLSHDFCSSATVKFKFVVKSKIIWTITGWTPVKFVTDIQGP